MATRVEYSPIYKYWLTKFHSLFWRSFYFQIRDMLHCSIWVYDDGTRWCRCTDMCFMFWVGRYWFMPATRPAMIEPSNKSLELPRDTVWLRNSRDRDDNGRQPLNRKLHRSNKFVSQFLSLTFFLKFGKRLTNTVVLEKELPRNTLSSLS